MVRQVARSLTRVVRRYPLRFQPPFVGYETVLLEGGLPPQFTHTRASSGVSFNSAGVLTTATTDTPRFDHNPSTLAPMGLLIEGTRTNLAQQSEVFSNAFWTAGGSATITDNAAVAPDGATTADLYEEASGSSILRNTSSITVVSGSTYTYSAFLKRGNCDWVSLNLTDSSGRTNGQQVWFNLATGAKGTSSTRGTGWTLVAYDIQPINNGWYRCWVAVTTGATTSFVALCSAASDGSTSRADIGSGAGVGGEILTWGWQYELGAFPSSYIATTSGAGTRSIDAVSTTQLSTLGFNAAAGTVIVEFDVDLPPSGQVHRLWQADSGADTTATRINGTISSSGSIRMNGASTQATGGTYTSGVAKAAFAWDGTNIYCCLNGGSVVSAADTVAASFTTFRLGGGVGSNTTMFGHMRVLAIYGSKIPDAQIQALTT